VQQGSGLRPKPGKGEPSCSSKTVKTEYTDSFCTPLLTANGKLAGGAARNVRLANIKDGIDGFARSIVASTLQAIDAQVLDQASAASSACDRTGKVTPIRRIQRRRAA
jgi:hypothetical protein